MSGYTERVNVKITGIRRDDLAKMIDEVYGACIWVGGACYPDGRCEVRIVDRHAADSRQERDDV